MKRFLVAIVLSAIGVECCFAAANVPQTDIELFNGRDLTGWYPQLAKRPHGADPNHVFSVKDGILNVSGAENGSLLTERVWRDYRLTIEYRWTGTGPGAEKGDCGDSGILLHVAGQNDTAFAGAWPICFECNLILGKTGDLCLLGNPKTSNDVTCLSWILGNDKHWDHWQGRYAHFFAGGRINAMSNRTDWKGKKGQLANPPENPEGEWNTLVITAKGGWMTVCLNGVQINAATSVKPNVGRIGLQSVGHGIAFRRVTLSPVPEAKPENVPPLMKTYDDQPVTSRDMWEKVRRPELLETFKRCEYGRRDVERPPELKFREIEPAVKMVDGKALRKRVEISWKGPYGTNAFLATAFIPIHSKPVPSFILICNRSAAKNLDPTRKIKSPFWPVEEIVARGYAAIAFFNGDIAPETYNSKTASASGMLANFRRSEDRIGTSCGTLSAWGWGASRVLDWIETEPLLDAHHVGVVGHSRGGKASLCAGVFDTRFAMTVSNCSGMGGAKLNHINLPESEHVAQICGSVSYWFCPDFKDRCIGRDTELSFDQHQFLALVAPRLLYVASASEDNWAGQEGEYYAAKLASPVWELYGRNGLVSTGFPSPDQAWQEGDVGYHLRKGDHNLTVFDWMKFIDFAERHGWRQ